jgi:hypothetical protein
MTEIAEEKTKATETPTRVGLYIDAGEDLSSATFEVHHLCEDCAVDRANAHEPVEPLPCASADPCEDCGLEVPEGPRVLLADYGDDGGAGPLGNVFMQKVAFPMEVYSEVSHCNVALPDERRLLKWANKQFYGFEIDLID